MDTSPTFRTNSSIILAETEVEFLLDGRSVRAPAKAVQKFFPKVHLTLEVTDVARTPQWAKQRIFREPTISVLKDGQTVSTPLVTAGPSSVRLANGTEIDVVPAQWLHGQSEAILDIAHSPCVALRLDKPMDHIQFGVVNFTWSGPLRSLCLQAEPWTVCIAPVSDLRELEPILRTNQGYGVTHEGFLERSDGAEFSIEQATEVLNGLNHFLSFLCGAHCSVNNALGTGGTDAEVWKRWGTYHVSPWRKHRSWYDITITDALPDIFAAFWQKWRTGWKSLGRIMSLYAESNEAENVDVSIILAQVALETFTHLSIGPKPRELPTGEWIAQALNAIGIATDVPGRLSELKGFQKRKGWKHGPHVIVEFRNPMIHAVSDDDEVSIDVYHEAKQLALWYLELALLRTFGYSGPYACRLVSVQSAGRTELVPWRQGC